MKNQILPTLISLAILAVSTFASAQSDFEVKQNDFKTLFNSVRTGQPEITPWPGTYWPYSYYGTSAHIVNGQFSSNFSTAGESPMAVFDQIAGQSGKNSAFQWEHDNHNCDNPGVDKEACASWWGHCNGWSAAAIKEDEPKNNFTVNGTKISTAAGKGIFSEVWLSSNSLFAGETNKSVTTESGLLPGGWIDNPADPNYKTFWDVSPRTFFLISTNYMGLAKMGFVIDRFTGNEVWNQPMVGYRVLPIDPATIRTETQDGRQIWAVPMKMKIYWGNDLDTPPGVISKGFDIEKDSNDSGGLEELPTGTKGEMAYEGRLLEFTLFFDSTVQVSPDGKQVLAAGRIVGDGIWKMQENPRAYSADTLNQSHPDFVWMPTNWVLDTTNGYGNPYLVPRIVSAISQANKAANGVVTASGAQAPSAATNAPAAPASNINVAPATAAKFRIAFGPTAFQNLASVNSVAVRRKLRRLFTRAGLSVSLPSQTIDIQGSSVTLTAEFPSGTSQDTLQNLFGDADVAVLSINSVN